ncbi:MAG: TIGR02266 family protein [Deltaproteobacteria bacterium]|nr:TIGR02266 family protein [Deltaproteobacteria bacterium]
MSNDERREKRVQASLKVRYKSATVTDFIEKHSHDISPGGVFIRSQKPLSKGSLLKIDFRLEDDTAVIQGVGRVVWTREDSLEGKPAGMGIKFIRLDEDSRDNILKIITMQRSGRAITRESVFGEGEDIDGLDATVPDGKSVRDSIIPSVENMDDADIYEDGIADEDMDDATASATKEEVPPSKPVPAFEDLDHTQPSQRISREDLKAKKRDGERSAVGYPTEEEKGSNWGIILVVLLVVAGAIAFILTREPERERVVVDSDGASAVTPDASEDAVKDDASAKEETAPAANDVSETVVDEDTQAMTETDSTAGTDSDTAADSDTSMDSDSSMDSAPDTASEDITTDAGDNASAELASSSGDLSGPISILVSERDAIVYVDGVAQENERPLKLAGLPVGEHTIRVDLFAYKPIEEKIVAVAGEPLVLSYALKRARFATTIRANVVGARIMLGEKQIGRTPMRTVKRFKDSFEYRIVKPKFKDVEGAVTRDDWVYSGGVYTLEIKANLEPEEPVANTTEDTSATAGGAN